MTSVAFVLREARLPGDEAAMIRFIDGSQAFEHALEPDRRIDPDAGRDYLPHLLKRVRDDDGRIFVAEAQGRAVGWGVFHTMENAAYIVPDERRYGYVAELFVEEAHRGRGVGRALIAACEDAARALGLKLVMIGVLAANSRARRIYEESGFAPYGIELRKYL
jgi:GNAT superfamily N-acetyltransferase